MLLKDYFIYLYYILKSEGKRVQRLFIIITLGSLLVFFIHFSTNIIKTKITQNYAGRYVLMPYLKNSQHLETSLPFELIKQEEIQLIQNTFIDTQILETVQNKEITLLNLSQNKSTTLSNETTHLPYFSIHPETLERHQWKLDDFYQLDAILLDKIETHIKPVDLLIPEKYQLEIEEETYDNFITLQTTDLIDDVLELINVSLTNLNYEYRIEDFSVNDLFISLITSVESILLGFSFLIFIVSSSNIGTIMPYFIGEFKDEIETLRLMGISHPVIFKLFMMVCVFILLTSLMFSLIFAYFLSMLFALVMKATFQIFSFKLFFLFIIQILFGCLFSFQSIKKATDSVSFL